MDSAARTSERAIDRPNASASAKPTRPAGAAHALDRAGRLRLRAAAFGHQSSEPNVAPIPLLWVRRSAFICSASSSVLSAKSSITAASFCLCWRWRWEAAAFALYYNKGNLNIKWSIPIFVAALFICCMVCHGELVRLKPDPRHLTNFYLMVAVGGALGGLFVAVGAPHLFHTLRRTAVGADRLSGAGGRWFLWITPGEWPRWWMLPVRRIAMIVFTVGAGRLHRLPKAFG